MGIQAKLILWLLSLAVVLAALYGAYQYGRHVEGLARDSQQLAKVERAIDAGNALAATDAAAASAGSIKAAARADASTQRAARVERAIAAHPDYTACALSAGDLADLNAAIQGE